MTNTDNDTIARRIIPSGTVFTLALPEFVGRMPVRPSLPYQGISRRTALREFFTDEQIETYSREIEVAPIRGVTNDYIGFDDFQEFSPVTTAWLPYVFVDIKLTPDSDAEQSDAEQSLDMEDGDFEWGEE